MDNEAKSANGRISGYLCLKTKRRVLSSWKSYWFILEDRLLLFYRSKAEYQAISPCKGSINLGPPCAVKSLPSVTNGFQVETRSTTYTLKAENSEEQKKWMQAILFVLKQNQNFSTGNPTKLSHFRYSLDNLIPEKEPPDGQASKGTLFRRQNSMPYRIKLQPSKSHAIIERLQRIGAHTYEGRLGGVNRAPASPVRPRDLNKSNGSLPDFFLKAEEEEVTVRPKRTATDNIYERISGDSFLPDRSSFVMDNENYSAALGKFESAVPEAIYAEALGRETRSLLVENDHYRTTNKEVIYAEPKVSTPDFNKNSVIVENSFYACADVASNQSHENLYEDLDKYSHYSQPVVRNTEGRYSSQSSISSKTAGKNPPKAVKKSKSLIRKLWKRKVKTEEKDKAEEEIYAEVDVTAVEKVSLANESAIQMLEELHNILENKKSIIMAKNSHVKRVEEKLHETSTSNSEQKCPTLPPKTHKASRDLRPNGEPNTRSLDEILEDLDREKVESKSKVQMLIEKFSESESGDVVLRKCERPEAKNCRHSDELSKLLNELTKVTSAPIMTPGVTSSLVNPHLSDEEWVELLPVRRRRLSEPDYDVPRPHRSIQLPVEKPEKADAIPATRFFGPALPPTLTDKHEDSLIASMTPDSLEVEREQEKYQTETSYTSHCYNNPGTNLCFPPRHSSQDDKIIYAMPKSYLSVATHVVNTYPNICGAALAEESTIVYKNVKNMDVQEEIFKDSLETLTEF